MKLFKDDIFKIFTKSDIDNIIKDINDVYPDTLTKNFYKDRVDPRLRYLNFIPTQLFDLKNPDVVSVLNPDGPIVLNLYDSINALPEEKIGWHQDSESGDQITVMFYPQIDVDSGGEFCTLAKTQQIFPGYIIVLPSNETHRILDYKSHWPRISLKWMFKVSEHYADTFRD